MILNLLLSTLALICLLKFGHNLSNRGYIDLTAVQSAHERQTARFGGISIIVGVSSIFFVTSWSSISVLLLLSGLPVFTAGLLEDITGKISPIIRLIAAFCSAVLALLFLQVYLQVGDFWLLDRLFVFPIVAIPITLLISSGIVNSFNLIDGINGFSAGIACSVACLLGYVCQIYDEPNLSYFCYMLAVACVPFLAANFPFGYIFLGDAGAYILGHLLFWIAILLLYRHPEISSWAILLIFFWPATEILLSMYRRFLSKKPSGAPDSFHLHHLIMQLLKLSFDKTSNINRWANPLSTLTLLPLAVFPMIIGLFVIESNIAAIFAYVLFGLGFLFFYVFLLRRVKTIALRAGRLEIVDQLDHVFTPKQK